MTRKNRERTFRQIGLGEHFADDQGTDRRTAGGFEHKGTTHGQRGRDLVSGEIQWKVERRNERARSDRDSLEHASITPCARRDFQVHDFAGHPHRFFGGKPERIDQPTHFATRILDRFARLNAQRPSGRSSKRWTQWLSTAWRSYGTMLRIGFAALTAAAMARSIVATSANATRVATSPVYLSITSRSAFGACG